MTRKSLGYVELEWTCKRCGTINPGMQKMCTNCGSPMDEADQFEMPDEQALITDETKLEAAKRGADIHCPYCGARNAAGVEACQRCGGDLSEGALRQAGKVVGAFEEGPAAEIDCPFCNAKVKAGSPRCPNCGGDLVQKDLPAPEAPAGKSRFNWLTVALVAILVLCIGAAAAYAVLRSRTSDVQAVVQSVNWSRDIEVLGLQAVEKRDWLDEVPAEAENVQCSDQERETRDEPAPKSTEVCGTPYTIDQGSGAGEVVQDCVYLVYDSYCTYSVEEWQVVESISASGSDLTPYWPELQLAEGQKEGERHENYVVVFVSGTKTYEYSLSDPNRFASFTPDSQWKLKVNALGGVNSVEP